MQFKPKSNLIALFQITDLLLKKWREESQKAKNKWTKQKERQKAKNKLTKRKILRLTLPRPARLECWRVEERPRRPSRHTMTQHKLKKLKLKFSFYFEKFLSFSKRDGTTQIHRCQSFQCQMEQLVFTFFFFEAKTLRGETKNAIFSFSNWTCFGGQTKGGELLLVKSRLRLFTSFSFSNKQKRVWSTDRTAIGQKS